MIGSHHDIKDIKIMAMKDAMKPKNENLKMVFGSAGITTKSIDDLQPIKVETLLLEHHATCRHCTRAKRNPTWVYKGINDPENLKTSLQRAAELNGILSKNIPEIELRLIRDYARGFLFSPTEPRPGKGETLQWLALMQHYQAPTRLLDFDYSFPIAAFFALSRTNEKDDCAILAIESQWVQDTVRDKLLGKSFRDDFKKVTRFYDGEAFTRVFLNLAGRKRFICAVSAARLNARLAVQQGLFLVPSDVTCSFLQNLQAIEGYEQHVIALLFKGNRQLVTDLYRSGISSLSLFPGLQGYGEHLWQKMFVLNNLSPKHDPIKAEDLSWF